jgi:hypothetical protein
MDNYGVDLNTLFQAWSWIGVKWQGIRRCGECRVKEDGVSTPGLGVGGRKLGMDGTNGMDEQTQCVAGLLHFVGFLRVLRSMFCLLSSSWTHPQSFFLLQYLLSLCPDPTATVNT